MIPIKIEKRTPEEREAYYQDKIAELEAENKKLKEENNSMIAAIYQIRQWTYIAFSGVKEE